MRNEKYKVVSEVLKKVSEEGIKNLLSSGEAIHKGIGGTGVKLEIESIPVFAKRIPVTDIELKNQFSTKNLFDLPNYY
jgi:hypothetical protein